MRGHPYQACTPSISRHAGFVQICEPGKLTPRDGRRTRNPPFARTATSSRRPVIAARSPRPLTVTRERSCRANRRRRMTPACRNRCRILPFGPSFHEFTANRCRFVDCQAADAAMTSAPIADRHNGPTKSTDPLAGRVTFDGGEEQPLEIAGKSFGVEQREPGAGRPPRGRTCVRAGRTGLTWRVRLMAARCLPSPAGPTATTIRATVTKA